MCLLKVLEGRIHLGHLLFENPASQIQSRFGGKLLNAESEKVCAYLEGTVIEGHFSKCQICFRVFGVNLNCLTKPFHRLWCVVVGFG